MDTAEEATQTDLDNASVNSRLAVIMTKGSVRKTYALFWSTIKALANPTKANSFAAVEAILKAALGSGIKITPDPANNNQLDFELEQQCQRLIVGMY